MEQEKIGKFIAKLRKEKGLTQDELGEKLSINGKTVSKWETGRTLPDISLLKSISDILGITVTELLTGEVLEKEGNSEKINDITDKAINKYVMSYKKKIGIIIGLLVLFILSIFAIYFYFENYYNYKLYVFSSDNKDFSVDAILIQNVENSVLTINSLSYIDTLRGTEAEIKTSDVKVEVYSDNQLISSKEKSLDKETYLGEILSGMNISVYSMKKDEEKVHVNPDNIYLIISYDSKKEDSTIFIHLKQ